jgi:uncharacterized protein (DUF924 family)
MPTRTEALAHFWRDAGPEKWYAADPAFDAEIRERFLADWQEARAGGMREGLGSPMGMLGYMILTDQFPRNMFRDQGEAFSTDSLARAVATTGVRRQVDLLIEGPLRQFFYLPFMHAETTFDQDRCVCLFLARMPGSDNLLHARAHREVIRRFGRFPNRNAALGRVNTPAETAFLDAGGYASVVKALA